MLSKDELSASIVIDFEGESNKKGQDTAPQPHMVGIFQPNSRGKSGKYSWVTFNEHWKPATNGSKGFGLPGSIFDFNSFFLKVDTDLTKSGGKLIHWSQHEADILKEHLTQSVWKGLAPKLFNARLPAKRYARKRRIFDGNGKTIGKSLEEFFEALYRKRRPFPPLPRGAAATCRLIDKACEKNKRWRTFTEKQKSYVSELIRYNEGDCRATWLIALKMTNARQR